MSFSTQLVLIYLVEDDLEMKSWNIYSQNSLCS